MHITEKWEIIYTCNGIQTAISFIQAIIRIDMLNLLKHKFSAVLICEHKRLHGCTLREREKVRNSAWMQFLHHSE
jgi:hypothetical protein